LEEEKLSLHGWNETRIARRFGLTPQEIGRDLKEIRAHWVLKHKDDAVYAREQALEAVDDLLAIYFAEYEASQKEKQITSTKQVRPNTGPGRSEAQLRTEQREGNATYLSGIQWCLAERARLLGTYAPTKSENKSDVHVVVENARLILESRINRIITRLGTSGVPLLDVGRGSQSVSVSLADVGASESDSS
jgi:hypothetical protein